MTLLLLVGGQNGPRKTTELSVSALPGKPHRFLAKTEASGTPPGPHTGLFTELSVSALPGQRHSFSAKDAAAVIPGGDHTGLFTALSVLATPGPIHSFSAKTAAAAVAEVIGRPETSFPGARARRIKRRRYEELLNDDIEVMMLLKKIVESGILE